MKNKVLVFFVAVLFCAAPVFGGSCMEELNALAPQLTSSDNGLTSEEMQSALNLFEEGMVICENGDEEGAAAIIAELKSML